MSGLIPGLVAHVEDEPLSGPKNTTTRTAMSAIQPLHLGTLAFASFLNWGFAIAAQFDFTFQVNGDDTITLTGYPEDALGHVEIPPRSSECR